MFRFSRKVITLHFNEIDIHYPTPTDPITRIAQKSSIYPK